jgi:hypothetical protein
LLISRVSKAATVTSVIAPMSVLVSGLITISSFIRLRSLFYLANITFYAYSMDGDIIYTPPHGVKQTYLNFFSQLSKQNVEDACFFRYNRQKMGDVLSINNI